MQLYRLHEADLVLPETPEDQSVQIFSFASHDIRTSQATPEFSVVISREAVGVSQLLLSYVDKQLRVLAENLPQFSLQERRGAFVDNVEADLAEYTWMSEHGSMYQRQAYLLCPAGVSLYTDKRTALTITGTSRESLHQRYALTFEQILYSLRFHR